MKVLSKLNRGAVLTAAVVLGVIIFLLINSISNTAQAKDIKTICEEYINTETRYSMLPEEYRNSPKKMSSEDLEDYIQEMKTNIKAFYPEDTKNTLTEELEDSLRNQAKGIGNIYEYNKKILNFEKIYFESGTQAIATIQTETTYNGPGIEIYERGYGLSDSKTSVQTTITTDNVYLQKINQKWYVISSELNTNGMYYNTYGMYY